MMSPDLIKNATPSASVPEHLTIVVPLLFKGQTENSHFQSGGTEFKIMYK